MSERASGRVARLGDHGVIVRLAIAVVLQTCVQLLASGYATEWRVGGDVSNHATVITAHDWVIWIAAAATGVMWTCAILLPWADGKLRRSTICFVLMVSLLGAWRVVSESWSVCSIERFGKSTYAVVRRSSILTSAHFLATDVEVQGLVTMSEVRSSLVRDWDSRAMRMVRPVSMSATGYSVQSTHDGWLLAMYGDKCLVAYNPSTGVALVDSELTRMSPFALVDHHDTCTAEDVARLVSDVQIAAKIGDLDQHVILVPRDAGLAQAVERGNSSVREAARQMIEAGGRSMYPTAIRRLSDLR